MSNKAPPPLSPSSVLPISSRERKLMCSQLRQSVAANEAEKTAQFESIVDVLMPLPSSTNLELFTNAIIPQQNLEKLECLLSGGGKLEDWSRQLRPFNISPVCGLVWSTSYIGYRCKTCSRNPNMSLCADCFRSGNHEGHDSNMFRSSSGGTCDCGNSSVMSPSGFCTFHGRSSTAKPPHELTATAHYILFRAVWRLNVFFRHCFFIQHQQRILSRSGRNMETEPPEELVLPFSVSFAESDLGKIIDWLESVGNAGYAAKEELVNVLLDEASYKQMNAASDDSNPLVPGASQWARAELTAALRRTIEQFSPALASEFYSNKDECRSILDELFRWLLATRLPTKLLNFLLSLLPVRHYASEMTRRLADQYPIVAALLCFNLKIRSETDSDRESKRSLAQRFLHVTVQLYSNADLANLAVFECSGLSSQLASLIALLRYSSVPRRLNVKIPVVNTENPVLGQAIAYWPLVSDLYNLIVHRPIATKLLTDYSLVKKWAQTMSLCQGMNANQRYFRSHIEMDSENAFSTAYSLELEACSAPLWLVAAQTEQAPWQQPEKLENAAQILKCLIDDLENHQLQGADSLAVPCAFEFSFHLPLHRAVSALLHAVHATYNSGVIASLLPKDERFLTQLVRPAIQLQGLRSEIGCNIWLRNGMVLRTKALAYAQTNFASSFIDLDLSLIQAALAAGLSTNRLVSFILEQYHVLDSFSIFNVRQLSSEEPAAVTSAFFGEQRYNEMVLLESALLLIAQLARLHLLPSMNIVAPEARQFYRRQLRREIVTQLCLGDRTYSELVDSIPQRHIASVELASSADKTGTTVDDVDCCIADVADFKEPDLNSTIASGTYVLRDSVWLNGRDFDPIHVMLRSYTRKDAQTCMDRFFSVVARASSVQSSTCAKQLWPPFCAANAEDVGDLPTSICAKSRVLHSAIFSVLFRYLNELRSGPASVTLPDQTVALSVYLLELGVNAAAKPPSEPTDENATPITVSDLDFETEWFKSDDIFDNLCQHIDYVAPPSSHFQQELRRRRLSELPVGLVDDSQWPGGGLDRAALSLLFSLPAGWRNAESGAKVAIGQSLLSLLVHIRNHFSQRTLPASCSNAGERVFDAFGYISSLLKKIGSLNATCQQNIDRIEMAIAAASKGGAEAESSSSGAGTVDAAKSTAAAAKRREKILALMQKQQKAFLEQMVVEGELEVQGLGGEPASLPELSVSLEQPALAEAMATTSALSPITRPKPAQTYDCCICNLSGPSTVERPFVVISMCQPSMVLHHRYDREGPFDLPPVPTSGTVTSERHLESVPSAEHRAGHARHVVATAFREYWRACFQEGDGEHDLPLRRPSSPSAPTSLVASSAFWPIDVHVTLCGSGSTQHACHFDCHHNYLRVNRSGNDPLNNVLEQLFAMPGANFEDVDLGAVANEPIDEALGGPGGNEGILAARELGEYACPLCRQLANSAVPLIPPSMFSGDNGGDTLPDPPAFDSAERLRQIAGYLHPKNSENVLSRRRTFPPNRSHLALALRQFQADLSLTVQQSPLSHDNAASALLRSSGVLGLTSLLLSITHANMEFCRMRPPSGEQCCPCQALFPLVSCVAACCYATLSTDLRLLHNSVFIRLTGLTEPDWTPSPASLSLPLLSYDPSTLLLLFVLSAFPLNSSSAYTTAVIQALFNLKVVQSVVKVAMKLSPSERTSWKISKNGIVSQVITQAQRARMFSNEPPSPPLGISSTVWSPQALADAVRCSCLSFLELATTLTCCLSQQQQQTCLFESNLRKPCGVAEKFLAFITCLGLDAGVVSGSSGKEVDPWDYVWFAIEDEASMSASKPAESDDSSTPGVLKLWFNEIAFSPSRQRLLTTIIGPMHCPWYPPRLLRVPNLFDQLFHSVRMYRCPQCKRVPTRAGLCLICGHIVCFREVCCNRDGIFEAVWHSRKCGAGTCLFLVINSSCIVCIRGPRYTVWGSPYLDSHGEEDRDLKRGRPLHLSTDRMAILERQWLGHSFDRVLRQWQWHSNRL